MTASTTIHPRGMGRRTMAGIVAAIAVAGGAAFGLHPATPRKIDAVTTAMRLGLPDGPQTM